MRQRGWRIATKKRKCLYRSIFPRVREQSIASTTSGLNRIVTECGGGWSSSKAAELESAQDPRARCAFCTEVAKDRSGNRLKVEVTGSDQAHVERVTEILLQQLAETETREDAGDTIFVLARYSECWPKRSCS